MFLPCRKKLLEVKHPFSQREILNFDEAVIDTDFFIDANKNFKKDHKYYASSLCVTSKNMICRVDTSVITHCRN